MVRFKDKKESKKERKMQERLKYDLIYEDLSEEEKKLVDTYTKELKYLKYAEMGFFGVTLAIALYNGYDILDGNIYDTALTPLQNIQYIVSVSIENFFTQMQVCLARLASIFLPFATLSIIENTTKTVKHRKNIIIKTEETKKNFTEKFFEYLAKRSLKINDNKVKIKKVETKANTITTQEDEDELLVF